MEEKKRVTILEDNDDYREFMTRVLENEGYEVFSASIGFEIFRDMATMKTDLILLDIMLPGITGDKVVTSFKHNNLLKDVPIIVVSSKDISEIKQVAERVGAVDYIQKPVEKERLIGIVEKYI